MKVCCCTYYSPSHKALADISLPNLSEYCARHGYYMRVDNIENDKWEYVKHKMFEELFDLGYGLIWYRDIDSVITNLSIPITSFTDEHYSFYITKDANELNGGSVIIKNTEAGRRFNKIILSQSGVYENEQNVYNSIPFLMFGVDFMKPLPHPSINSYDYSLYPEFPNLRRREDGHHHEGDFVLHVPALSMERRIEVLKNAKITR
jgi:hypothetical protein